MSVACQKFQQHVIVVCQKIQEHVKEARDKNVITPPPPTPQPQEYAKMYKNAKGVYLRASNYNTTLHNTTLHYTILRYTIYTTPQLQPHDTTRLHTHTTLDYTTLYYTRVHNTTVHYTTVHYTTLHYPTLLLQLYNYNCTNYTTLHLHLHYTTTTTALHHTTSSSRVCVWGDHCNHCNHFKKHKSNHLSVHQWIHSAIRDSQQPTSPIVFLFLELPPLPCAVLLEYETKGDKKVTWINAYQSYVYSMHVSAAPT